MYGLYGYKYKNIIYIMAFTLIGSSWEHLWTIHTIQELQRGITIASHRNPVFRILPAEITAGNCGFHGFGIYPEQGKSASIPE